ncbi:hypothetical protein J4E91_009272 [Alternaria rosae]|nr:hypothetical protein J4E91_009272 [Alternaria rosae]
MNYLSSSNISAVGSQVTEYQVGDRVLISKRFGTQGNAYGAYQRYAIVAAGEKIIIGVPPWFTDSEEKALVAVVMNASCVPGLFSGRLGLRRPDFRENEQRNDDEAGVRQIETSKKEKILVYGGSSSFGRLAVQYLGCAGYDVTTTSSPLHMASVRSLIGSDNQVIDHMQPPERVIAELKARGPYDIVVDMISTPQTIPLTSRILVAQGGGKLFTTQPAFGPERLPEGVERIFEPWSDSLYEEGNEGLMEWVVGMYLPFGMEKGWMSGQAVEMVEGLEGVDAVLGGMIEGCASGKRFVVEVIG